MKALPSTERGRRTRAAIVGAAAELMHRRGLAAPSMDDILAASGAGKSQLYHYFDGRGDLAEAVLRHQFERVMANQPALHDPTCADLEAWRDQVLAAHRESSYGTCPLGSFVGQVKDDVQLSPALAELFEQWQRLLAALVGRAQRQGRVRAEADPADGGQALLAALQGGTILSHLARRPEPLHNSLNAAIALLSR